MNKMAFDITTNDDDRKNLYLRMDYERFERLNEKSQRERKEREISNGQLNYDPGNEVSNN